MQYADKGAAAIVRGCLRLLVLAGGSLLAVASYAAPPFRHACGGDRDVGSLVWHIQRHKRSRFRDQAPGPASPDNGQSRPDGHLQVGANQRYNVGASSPVTASVPTSRRQRRQLKLLGVPTPFSRCLHNVDGNACATSPGATRHVGHLTSVRCSAQADANGFWSSRRVTWETTPGPPRAARRRSPSGCRREPRRKCNVSATTSTPVIVLGSITINKTASESARSTTPHGRRRVAVLVTTSAAADPYDWHLSTNTAIYTISESATAGFALTGCRARRRCRQPWDGDRRRLPAYAIEPNVTCTTPTASRRVSVGIAM